MVKGGTIADVNERIKLVTDEFPFVPTEQDMLRYLLAADNVTMTEYNSALGIATSSNGGTLGETFDVSPIEITLDDMLKEYTGTMCGISSFMPKETYNLTCRRCFERLKEIDSNIYESLGCLPYTADDSGKNGIPFLSYRIACRLVTLDNEKQKKQGSIGAENTIKSLNFLLKLVNIIRHYYYKGKIVGKFALIKYDSGVGKVARSKGNNRTRQYKIAKTKATDSKGKQTLQEDPLGGKRRAPLLEEEELRIAKWFKLGERDDYCRTSIPVDPPFQRARNSAVYSLTTGAICRGDDVRHPEVSIAHCGMLPLPNRSSIQTKHGYIYFLYKDFSKNYKSKDLYAGLVRGPDAFLCKVNSIGQYIILSFGYNGKRAFPDIFKGENNYCKNTPLITDDHGKKPWYYDEADKKALADRLSKGEVDFFDDELDNNVGAHSESTQYAATQSMLRACGLETIGCVTHLKFLGLMKASYYGASNSDMQQQGRYLNSTQAEGTTDNKALLFNYLLNLSPSCMIAIAGYQNLVYSCWRDLVVDLGSLEAIENLMCLKILLNHMFPGILDIARRAEAAFNGKVGTHGVLESDPVSYSNKMCTHYCVAVTVAWITDAVINLEHYPLLKNEEPYDHLLSDSVKPSWEQFSAHVKRVQQQNADVDVKQQLQFQEVIQAVTNIIMNQTAPLNQAITKLDSTIMSQVASMLDTYRSENKSHEIDTALSLLSSVYDIPMEELRSKLPFYPIATHADLENTQADNPQPSAQEVLQHSPSSTKYNLVFHDKHSTAVASFYMRQWSESILPLLEKWGPNHKWWTEGDKKKVDKINLVRRLYDGCCRRVQAGRATDVNQAASQLDSILIDKVHSSFNKSRTPFWTDLVYITRKAAPPDLVTNDDAIATLLIDTHSQRKIRTAQEKALKAQKRAAVNAQDTLGISL